MKRADQRSAWEVVKQSPDTHVLPIDDLMTHTYNIDCACRPRRDEVAPQVVIHNSRDGREHYEPKWAERTKC